MDEKEVEYTACHESGVASIRDLTYAIQDGWMCSCGEMIGSEEEKDDDDILNW